MEVAHAWARVATGALVICLFAVTSRALAQDSTPCPGFEFDGLRLEGRALTSRAGGAQEVYIAKFEAHFLQCGVVTVAECRPGIREVFLWQDPSKQRYAVSGWDPALKGDSFLNLGRWLDGQRAGVATPFFDLWRAQAHPEHFLEVYSVRSDTGDCDLVVRQDARGGYVGRTVFTFNAAGALSSTEFVLENPGGGESVMGVGSVQGALPDAPHLPSRLETRSLDANGLPTEASAWEITRTARIDPAMDCTALFEKLSAGMVEIRPGQRYLGPDKGIATIDGEPIAGTPAGGGGLSAWWTRNRVFVLSCAVVLALAFGARRLLGGRTRRRRG